MEKNIKFYLKDMVQQRQIEIMARRGASRSQEKRQEASRSQERRKEERPARKVVSFSQENGKEKKPNIKVGTSQMFDMQNIQSKHSSKDKKSFEQIGVNADIQ